MNTQSHVEYINERAPALQCERKNLYLLLATFSDMGKTRHNLWLSLKCSNCSNIWLGLHFSKCCRQIQICFYINPPRWHQNRSRHIHNSACIRVTDTHGRATNRFGVNCQSCAIFLCVCYNPVRLVERTTLLTCTSLTCAFLVHV